MKNELMDFNKKNVGYIKSKFSVNRTIKSNSKFDEEEENYREILKYKRLLDDEKIKEEEIPYKYREKIREMYEREIAEIEANKRPKN